MNLPIEWDEKPPLILLVDDILQNIQILHHILSHENYSFALAGSGAETFAVLEKKLPDLILLDIMLEGMDGFEICKHLKSDPKTAGIPVIFLTARVRLEDKVKGFQLGAVDYITKPFEEAEVIARVRTHLQLKRSADIIKKYNEQLEAVNHELTEKNRLILNQKEELERSLHLLQKSQKELVEMEKKNAIMAMAVTSNHELNQPLTVIQGYLELLRQSLPESEDLELQKKYLGRIDLAFKKMIKIMENFRNSPAAQLEEYAKNKKMVFERSHVK
ncbi:MAG: response regulator [Acidobacteria bacterium]|jgi:DNA-binding response OmpR family regulator|nr:response regulator [Acidobacteriota bacterium]